MTLRIVTLTLVLAAVATPAMAQQRLDVSNPDPLTSTLAPALRLAGPVAVSVDETRRDALRVVPLDGGPTRRVPVPGVAETDSLDVVDTSRGRVALALRASAFEAPAAVLTGPPDGPFSSPAACGETAMGPAALDGDRIAYVAVPDPAAACPAGTDPVSGSAAVVVRDLATGARLAQVPVPDPGDVVRLALAGDHLALQAVESLGGYRRSGPLRVLTLAGATVTSIVPRATEVFALGADGTVVAHGGSPYSDGSPCTAVAARFRVYRPGDDAGVPIADRVCTGSVLRLTGGRLLYGVRAAPFRVDVVERDLATGARRVLLERLGGALLDADERTLLATTADCVDVAVVALPVAPARLARPRSCPIRVRAPRSVPRRTGARVPVRITCPNGCSAAVDLRVGGRTVERYLNLRPGRRTAARLRLRLPRVGGATVVKLDVQRYTVLDGRREVRRRIRFR